MCGLLKVCHGVGILTEKACTCAKGQREGENRFPRPSVWNGLKASHYVTQMHVQDEAGDSPNKQIQRSKSTDMIAFNSVASNSHLFPLSFL